MHYDCMICRPYRSGSAEESPYRAMSPVKYKLNRRGGDIMTKAETMEKILAEVFALFAQYAALVNSDRDEADASFVPAAIDRVEMLTIKEAVDLVPGMKEYTLRQLVLRGDIPSVRTGQGKNGKILISKDALYNNLNGIDDKRSI